MSEIGNKIRALRISKGMTQQELAEKCGYKSRVSINKIELERDIPIYKLIPIAKALDVTPQELMGWDKEDEIEELKDNLDYLIESEGFKRLDASEIRLVKAYREADELTKAMVSKILCIEKDR